MIVVDTHELAWAAGLFDGEGCVRVRTEAGKHKRHRGLSLSLGQMDRFVLDRFQHAVGVGAVYKERRTDGMFVWQTGARDLVQRVMWLLWPWLSPVKRQQFHGTCERYLALAPTKGGGSHS